ncbi:PH domain-containing protein [Homoserinibacter sp. YIM 151385]|uniref:PH domain-containing protein n=1 Tax=Homoserinibacter sp. YIM 151385 TaxID=2985506 RepID=UPI0022F0F937|nr:PH domain-containing protein [Homoserinibacter sp. YIM 151385]WBU38117.1 PH domain-containing protein [Homoserinibacter sp. YIM 151385]
MAPGTETFRSRFNHVLSCVIWAVCAAIAAVVVLTPGEHVPVVAALPLLGIAGATWILLWRPHVAVDDAAVTIANATHAVRIPWEAVIHVDTKYSLAVHVPGRRYTAIAAPAPGRMTGFAARRGEDVAAEPGDRVRPGDLASTDSGRAAQLVRGRWEALRDAGRIESGLADRTRTGRRPDLLAIAVLAGSLAAVLLPLALGRG